MQNFNDAPCKTRSWLYKNPEKDISHRSVNQPVYHFYIPENVEKGVVIKYCGNDSIKLKKILTTGSITLSNLKFEYEMENNNIEEDNE